MIATAWPEFGALDWRTLLAVMTSAVVVDANGFLAGSLRHRSEYAAVGMPGAAAT